MFQADCYYTVKEIAGKLKVDGQTIRRAIKRGDLKGLKLQSHGEYRITGESLIAFLESRKI